MNIEYIKLFQYRNFAEAHINLARNSLVIGGNDVGKTNMIHALRVLLDKSLSDADIEPSAQDFHCFPAGGQANDFTIRIAFSNVKEDAVLSLLKGYVSASGHFFLEFRAKRADLSYGIFAGHDLAAMEEISSRFYLKHLHLKYVHSQRDLLRYIRSEKKHLLRLAQELRSNDQIGADNVKMAALGEQLKSVNAGVKNLSYVSSATSDLNTELQKLAHHHTGYNVSLDTGAIDIQHFIEQLELGASTNGSPVMLGGDGRNNQILLALWKAKSVHEHDKDNEVVIYCVEEPEAHLHPHQQRKLASYLIDELPGQTIVTTHSPQISASYPPNSVVRLLRNGAQTFAASNGCSAIIDSSWKGLGYRMSILPAEAFFASAVLLVEGPSEMLFYAAVARNHGIDLDRLNISLLSVDGVSFEVYRRVLVALAIPFSMRTDNDISLVSSGPRNALIHQKNLAGMNRALALAGLQSLPHAPLHYTQQHSIADNTWQNVSNSVNPQGIFISQIDLENDIAAERPDLMAGFKDMEPHEAIAYLQGKKAVRMQEFVDHHGPNLRMQEHGQLLRPLRYCEYFARQV